MKRRNVLRAGVLLPLVVTAGCFPGAGRAPHTWWVLEVPGTAGAARPDEHRASLSLVVEGIAAGGLYDGTALIYSRGAAMRAPYLYASWSERPAARLARLAQRRLQVRGGFRDVTLAEAGVAPDLLLTLTLDRLDHDLSANDSALQPPGNGSALEPMPGNDSALEPGNGGELQVDTDSELQVGNESRPQLGNGGELQLALTATLVDWQARRPVAWRHFSAVEPVATANAAAAVHAASEAAERVLEELAPWVEASAAGLDRAPVRSVPPPADPVSAVSPGRPARSR